MKVICESGSIYEFTKDRTKFRRLRKRNPVDPEAPERTVEDDDGTWLRLFLPVEPVIGQPMTILVDADGESIYVRVSTVVVGVEE